MKAGTKIKRLPLNDETCRLCKMCDPKRSHTCKFTGQRIVEIINQRGID